MGRLRHPFAIRETLLWGCEIPPPALAGRVRIVLWTIEPLFSPPQLEHNLTTSSCSSLLKSLRQKVPGFAQTRPASLACATAMSDSDEDWARTLCRSAPAAGLSIRRAQKQGRAALSVVTSVASAQAPESEQVAARAAEPSSSSSARMLQRSASSVSDDAFLESICRAPKRLRAEASLDKPEAAVKPSVRVSGCITGPVLEQTSGETAGQAFGQTSQQPRGRNIAQTSGQFADSHQRLAALPYKRPITRNDRQAGSIF